jgi:pimeloyl-ACP methyl ester carboxylesterase
VTAHEPPLLGITQTYTPSAAPLCAELSMVNRLVDEVGDMLRVGDLEGGARHFIDAVVLGRGAWQRLPDESRRIFVANAATFLDTIGDPHWADVPEPAALPVLLTDGDDSPNWLPAIVAALASTTYRHAQRHTFAGAGHVPHLSHPDDYVSIVDSFIASTHVEHR